MTMVAQHTLFPEAIPAEPVHGGYILRDYQVEDCDECERLFGIGKNRVLIVHATGLGKSVVAAELAGRKADGTRALIIVDSTDLTKDLYRTVKHHLGRKPGILTGDYKEDEHADILIATKQCLCAGDKYCAFDPMEFDRLIIDECESSLANEYLVLVSYFLERNPDLKLVGLTATPLPAGNRNITDLFEHAAKKPGPLYRDLQWAYINGWLVKPLQGVLRCSLDFASLKVRKRENGEEDYSDRDIAKLMLDQDERQWLELAGGIFRISKGHTAVVVCPNSTAVADKLAGYIEGHAREAGSSGVAYSIHRSLGRRRSWDLMRRFKRGDFPVAVSVRMFEKGFDYDRVNMVVMVRRTRSLRLYTQIAGRGTRPLLEIRKHLADYPNANSRMRLISQSDKPSCVIVDCVGIHDDAKNILGVIDILGRGVRDDVKERVRRMMLDKARGQLEAEQKGEKPDEEHEDVGKQARQAIKQLREEWDRERERRAAVSADVDVSYEIDRGQKMQPVALPKPFRGGCSPKQAALLIALGVTPETALGYSVKQAGAVMNSFKKRGVHPSWWRVSAWENKHGKIE
jgi:superfamily II DNA or RNA helicase